MRLTYPMLILLCAALLPMNGCERIKEEQKNRRLEYATSSYRQAIRWGYYDSALQFVEPDKRPKTMDSDLENIRVTGYEVIQAPVMTDDETAEQLARIEYVLRDRQRLESITDRQRWQYHKDTSRWLLTSGLPAFKQSGH